MTATEKPTCEICGEPMPPGEEMFKYHGLSGPCPKPPLPKKLPTNAELAAILRKQSESPGCMTEDDFELAARRLETQFQK